VFRSHGQPYRQTGGHTPRHHAAKALLQIVCSTSSHTATVPASPPLASAKEHAERYSSDCTGHAQPKQAVTHHSLVHLCL
jgi:hypothetical protein